MSFSYEREPYRTELPVEVVGTGTEESRPYVLLSDTVLYPEGGGQPADRGWIGGIAVLDVQKRGAEIRHFVGGPVAPGRANLELDWPRRFDHMQQHTGQHLLTAVAADRFGWETLAFHLGAEVSTIEIGASRPERRALDALEEAVAAEVRAARPVRVRNVSPSEIDALPVRTRGLPEGHTGDVRLVEIEGVDLNTCGGTHLVSTAEIESLKVLAAEAHGKTSLLSFVCGRRARGRFGASEAVLAELRSVLQAPDAELAGAARAKLEQLKAAERRLRDVSGELAAARGAALASAPGPLASEHLEGSELPFLQEIARAFVPAASAKTLLLTGGTAAVPVYVVAVGEEVAAAPAELGRAAAEALGGRGGGSGRIFQGRATAPLARDAALAALRDRLK